MMLLRNIIGYLSVFMNTKIQAFHNAEYSILPTKFYSFRHYLLSYHPLRMFREQCKPEWVTMKQFRSFFRVEFQKTKWYFETKHFVL